MKNSKVRSENNLYNKHRLSNNWAHVVSPSANSIDSVTFPMPDTFRQGIFDTYFTISERSGNIRKQPFGLFTSAAILARRLLHPMPTLHVNWVDLGSEYT
jgi:hypothetical protein